MIGTVATPGTEYPERTIYDPAGDVYYVPFVAEDGRVGYRVGRTDSRADVEHFVYLNPSANGPEDPGKPDVFLYVGVENDPAGDEPIVFVALDKTSLGI